MKKIITFYQPTFLKTAIYFNTFLKNLKKLHKLTNELYKILKNGAAKTIKFVALCLACVIYEGIHIWKENNVGETKRNVKIRWQEHWDTSKIY